MCWKVTARELQSMSRWRLVIISVCQVSVFFNIIISDIDDDDNKLRGTVDTAQGTDAIQKDLDNVVQEIKVQSFAHVSG